MSNWYERWSAGEHMTPQPVDEVQKLKEDLEELQSTFNLIWKAQQRAIQMWQQKTGQGLNWPDKASLIVWLMEENEGLRKQNQSLMANAFPLTSKEELLERIEYLEQELETERLRLAACGVAADKNTRESFSAFDCGKYDSDSLQRVRTAVLREMGERERADFYETRGQL